MRGLGLAALWLGGCHGDETEPVETGTGPVGACGDVSSIPSLSITGRVRDVDQNWVEGVDLALEERNWSPGTVHGTATTGPGGTFTMSASDLPVVEDCWGTAVQFWLHGTADGLDGDKPMNPLIEAAWSSGETAVDLGDFPLIVYPE